MNFLEFLYFGFVGIVIFGFVWNTLKMEENGVKGGIRYSLRWLWAITIVNLFIIISISSDNQNNFSSVDNFKRNQETLIRQYTENKNTMHAYDSRVSYLEDKIYIIEQYLNMVIE